MSERHKATVVLARELPSRWVNMCSLQKKWDASKFRPITEFKNPIHPSYVDTEREGHVCRSPTVPARVETPDEEPPSTPTPQSRTNLRKNVPCFQQIPNCTLVLPSEVTFAYHSWIFLFFLRQFHRLRGNLSCLEPKGKTHQSLQHFGICSRWAIDIITQD